MLVGFNVFVWFYRNVLRDVAWSVVCYAFVFVCVCVCILKMSLDAVCALLCDDVC